jgi:2-polyprenyl-3-methyl-5-hydroxy-6-metoxy-1,4-benzoquinol methylase
VNATPSSSRRDAVVEQVYTGVIGALETLHVYLGDRLGLYTALWALDDGASSSELAGQAGITERYAREWLEQQAVSGLVDLVDDNGDPRARRYRLPPEVAEVMTDRDNLNYLAPLAPMVAGIWGALPDVLEAFQTGGGVPYEAYGTDVRNGIARLNRPGFLQQLASEWIAAMPDIEARLRNNTDPPPRIADLGCGTGWSSIALALAYPAARVDGIDLDEASITEARQNAENSGVADRLQFHRASAGEAVLDGQYDLVTFFETVHDMAYPVAALQAAATMLATGGAVLVGDEKVAERFSAPGDDLERFNYGWSAVHCLPAAMTVPDSAATGTVMRPAALKRFARQAGFSSVTVLEIEHDFWRFYRLDR